MIKEITLDAMMNEESRAVQCVVRDEQRYLAQSQNYQPTDSLYRFILKNIAENTRNTAQQLTYFEAYERALAVFRLGSVELRKEMDIITLEQRLAAQESIRVQRGLPQLGKEKEPLYREVSDAIFFSNRYALAFAGHVGLAFLGSKPLQDMKKLGTFGEQYDSMPDKDVLTARLTQMNRADLAQRLKERQAQNEKMTDADLKEMFEGIFTSWINQFSYATFTDIARQRGVEGTALRWNTYSMKDGEFKQKYDLVIVDDKLIKAKKEDVMGNTEFGDVLWSSMLKLACYDHEHTANPFNPPSVIYTYSEPGAGKTFVSNAFMQSFSEFCKEKGIACWLLAHSTTDYASHYQNKTANELAALGTKIRDFPGIVVMYAADIDNIFQSRKDERMTAEQQQAQSVYFKMFDGSMIPKNGKFMAIMDSNYVHGIDDATKSRIFDVMLELKRFDKPEHFAALIERKLTKGLETKLLAPEAWNKIGSWLLASPLSNREIDHVTNQLRGKLSVPESLVTAPFTEKVAYRNKQLQELLTKDSVISAFQAYIDTRMEIDRKARESLFQEDHDRFVNALSQKHVPTTPSAPSGV